MDTITTTFGADMVAAATRFAQRFAMGAMAHDRSGTFATEHLDQLRTEGFLAAPEMMVAASPR